MSRTRTMTLRDVKRAASTWGGTVESDGCGGYDVLAPRGYRWIVAEVWCYPLPLSEAESKEERQEMLTQAVNMLRGGIEND